MLPRLILNADDFGLTPGVNRAVEELHQANALTSATLMACGPAFDDAVRIAHENPSLGVGCHIVLLDGTPTAPAHEVPTLLEPGTNHLRSSLVGFMLALYTGRISTAEIEREAIAQIRKLQSVGIQPTHIDTHKHTHIFPRVTSAVLRAAVACGVKAIRNPIEPAWSAPSSRSPRSLAEKSEPPRAASASRPPARSTAKPWRICSKPCLPEPGSSSPTPVIWTRPSRPPVPSLNPHAK